jgi:hypothetical protein
VTPDGLFYHVIKTTFSVAADASLIGIQRNDRN